ncbi:ethanolamine ammonia-lyase subunit EutB, partial [Rhizobium ruizarguesonis]
MILETAATISGVRPCAFAPVSHMTVGEFRDWLLSYDATSEKLLAIA